MWTKPKYHILHVPTNFRKVTVVVWLVAKCLNPTLLFTLWNKQGPLCSIVPHRKMCVMAASSCICNTLSEIYVYCNRRQKCLAMSENRRLIQRPGHFKWACIDKQHKWGLFWCWIECHNCGTLLQNPPLLSGMEYAICGNDMLLQCFCASVWGCAHWRRRGFDWISHLNIYH